MASSSWKRHLSVKLLCVQAMGYSFEKGIRINVARFLFVSYADPKDPKELTCGFNLPWGSENSMFCPAPLLPFSSGSFTLILKLTDFSSILKTDTKTLYFHHPVSLLSFNARLLKGRERSLPPRFWCTPLSYSSLASSRHSVDTAPATVTHLPVEDPVDRFSLLYKTLYFLAYISLNFSSFSSSFCWYFLSFLRRLILSHLTISCSEVLQVLVLKSSFSFYNFFLFGKFIHCPVSHLYPHYFQIYIPNVHYF